MASSAIERLPEVVLGKIFDFCGDPRQLLRLERVCTLFRKLLAQDVAWMSCCSGALEGSGSSFRVRACIRMTLENIRTSQRSPSNVILNTFGADGFISFLIALFSISPAFYDVRGDTLALLVEVLQDYFVNLLRQVNKVTTHAAEKYHEVLGQDVYPEVSVSDCETTLHLLSLGQAGYTFHEWGKVYETTQNRQCLCYHLSDEWKRKAPALIRNLANRAGLVKYTNDFASYVWWYFVEITEHLMVGARERTDATVFHGREFAAPEGKEIDLWNDQPPNMPIADHPWGGATMITIIPRTLLATALDLGITKAVYHGLGWIARESKTVKEEKEEALLPYRYKSNVSDDDHHSDISSNDDKLKNESGVDSDFDVLGDESEGYYSVYSDDEYMYDDDEFMDDRSLPSKTYS